MYVIEPKIVTSTPPPIFSSYSSSFTSSATTATISQQGEICYQPDFVSIGNYTRHSAQDNCIDSGIFLPITNNIDHLQQIVDIMKSGISYSSKISKIIKKNKLRKKSPNVRNSANLQKNNKFHK